MAKKDSITELDVRLVYPNPDQPRKDFNEDKLEELAMSISQHGVLEPLVVTPRGRRYMIVAGERRYRASLLAELKKVPVRVIKADDALVEELALLENIQRQDLNIIEEGMAYRRLLDRGWTVEELAKRLGYKKTGPIYDRLSLLNLKDEYRAMTIEGKLNPSQAYEMSRLPKGKQDLVFVKIQRGELKTWNKLYYFVTAMLDLENQQEIFALTPLSEKEEASIKSFNGMVASVEKLIKRFHEEGRLNDLQKTALHSDVTTERIDLIIGSLQKIRLVMLTGEGLKEAMKAA